MDTNVEKTYKKVSPREHVLLRPDTYVGSVESIEDQMWIMEDNQLVFKKISYIPGLYKIFDEILVNAADNEQRDRRMGRIEVHFTQREITIWNDGKSIPIQVHKEHKVYVPELIFGHLLTSSNYNDQERKVVGGRNGYGAKLANIFSEHFEIEVADSHSKKIYKQSWTANMSQMGQPQISQYEGKDFTRVTFRPDFRKFGVKNFSPDMLGLMRRRVEDISGILKSKVYLNKRLVQVANFREYVKMYVGEEAQLVEYKTNRWHVLITGSQGQFMQVSLVNAINTSKGGTHVNYLVDQVVTKLQEHFTKKKAPVVRPHQIKAHLKVFVNCLIQNPAFDSQTKETLTTKVNRYGSSCELPDGFMKDLLKTGIPEAILSEVKLKQSKKIDKQLKKVKRNRLIIPKLDDANEAGRSKNCCLILTEGDSAKALALCGIQQLGRDYYGVYPLRGKLPNVRDLSHRQIMQNNQLSNIVKIMGLSFGKEYHSTDELRYSSVMIMADQDTDGSHIKGLVINFFQHFWPSLCQIKGFLRQFITPLVRCKKGSQTESFFSQADYRRWKEGIQEMQGWNIKYYKGLGTSTAKEAKEYFSNLNLHELQFSYRSQQDKAALELAFNRKNADARKQWLQQYDPELGLDANNKVVPVEEFVNKELIHFSSSDNVRSIPSLMDGLKPSQRKVLFACFKRNLVKEMKVAQLAGYVAQHSAYHHGQMSLCMTIVGMAQNYPTSNNLNLLQPRGQFGTRHMNGKDHASARYIFTRLDSLTRYLFNEADDHVVQYLQQDNQSIEPKYYLPVLPLVLINGCMGIGTGWSTSIYPYKVEDVIRMLRDRLDGRETSSLIGWENYQGTIEQTSKGYLVRGYYEESQGSVIVREIPVNRSIRQYKQFLQAKLGSVDNRDPDLEEVREYHRDNQIEFVINFVEGKQPDAGSMQSYLKLSTLCQQTNLTLFNKDSQIRRYSSIIDILDDFIEQRLKGYQKRKRYLISKFQKQHAIIVNQIRFICEMTTGRFQLVQSKDDWLKMLRQEQFTRYQDLNRIESTKNRQESDNDRNRDYNYLLNMPIWSFCHQKISQLQKIKTELISILEYYREVSPRDLWVKDINDFEEAWKQKQGGSQAKKRPSTHSVSNGRGRVGSKREGHRRKNKDEQLVFEQQKSHSISEKPKNTRQSGRSLMTRKNIMEEQIEKDHSSLKKQNPAKEIKAQEPERQSEKAEESEGSGIDKILSKYLCQGSERGELSLEERIKARIAKGDSSFQASYQEVKDAPLSPPKKMEENEDWLE